MIASDLESSSSKIEPIFIPKKLPEERRRPAEHSRIDILKAQHEASVFFVVDKLK